MRFIAPLVAVKGVVVHAMMQTGYSGLGLDYTPL